MFMIQIQFMIQILKEREYMSYHGGGLHGEIPVSVMRQREREEPWARDFIVVSLRKNR